MASEVWHIEILSKDLRVKVQFCDDCIDRHGGWYLVCPVHRREHKKEREWTISS